MLGILIDTKEGKVIPLDSWINRFREMAAQFLSQLASEEEKARFTIFSIDGWKIMFLRSSVRNAEKTERSDHGRL